MIVVETQEHISSSSSPPFSLLIFYAAGEQNTLNVCIWYISIYNNRKLSTDRRFNRVIWSFWERVTLIWLWIGVKVAVFAKASIKSAVLNENHQIEYCNYLEN